MLKLSVKQYTKDGRRPLQYKEFYETVPKFYSSGEVGIPWMPKSTNRWLQGRNYDHIFFPGGRIEISFVEVSE